MWFWLISSIASSIIGSATEGWFKDTKVGVWFYAKLDSLYTWASKRYGLKILTDEDKKMEKFPQLKERLEVLEKKVKELESGTKRPK